SGAGGRRPRDKRERLRGKKCEGKDCAGECTAGCGAGLGGWEIWGRGNRELCAESKDCVVGRRRESDSVGTFGDVFRAQDICVHGFSENGTWISGAAGAGREHSAKRLCEGGAAFWEL